MQGIVPEHWAEKSLPEQLANIGSEAHRALSSAQRGDEQASQHAWSRVFDLLDASIATQHARTRIRELLRLREVCGAFLVESSLYASSEELERYFFSFALFVAQKR